MADSVSVHVAYCDKAGALRAVHESEFDTQRLPTEGLLRGYHYSFVRNVVRNASSGFLSRINPGLLLCVAKYDIVFLHGMGVLSYWISFFGSLFWRKTILMKGEATPELYEGIPRLRAKVRIWLYRQVLKRCRCVFYSCEGNRAFWKLHGVPDTKLRPLPCAVDNSYFQTQAHSLRQKRLELRRAYDIAETDTVFVMACRMTNRKRPHDLVDAAIVLHNEGMSNFTLLFIGDGPERAKLEHRCAQEGIKANFTGFMPESRISEGYIQADVGVVISEYDPSPKAMNEMMNFEMPVICSNVVGTVLDLVKPGQNGFAIPVGDISSIVESMKYFIVDAAKRAEMGRRSKEIVDQFTFTRQAECIRTALDSFSNQSANN